MHDTAPTTRRGFILVMTLMLLTMAAVALAAAGRSSMGLAVNAVQVRQDLQRRWASDSIQHSALAIAPDLLLEAEEESGEPVISRHTEIQLGGQTYSLTVSDEQAKVNINALLHHRGRAVAGAFVRDSLGSLDSEVFLPTDPPARVRKSDDNVGLARRMVSLNHLMPGFDPVLAHGVDIGPLESVTCWGDGRINISRAPDELVREITRPMVGSIQLDRLRKALVESNAGSLSDALNAAGIAEQDIQSALERMTLESSCYSVWVSMDNGRRSWHTMSVLEMEPVDASSTDSASDDESASSVRSVAGDATPNEVSQFNIEGLIEEESGEFAARPISEDQSTIRGELVQGDIPDESVSDNQEATTLSTASSEIESNESSYPRLHTYQW